jgi:hypothetical protein
LANFVGSVVGFLNPPQRTCGAASLSFDRMRNRRARNKNNFLPYREVTPSRRQLQSKMV